MAEELSALRNEEGQFKMQYFAFDNKVKKGHQGAEWKAFLSDAC